MRWLMLLNGWKVFRRELRVEARYALTTEFPLGRRFETTPVEILKKAEVVGELEFLIVPESASPEDVLAQHQVEARAFAGRSRCELVPVATEAHFFEIETIQAARAARKLRGSLAGAATDAEGATSASAGRLPNRTRSAILWVAMVIGFAASWRLLGHRVVQPQRGPAAGTDELPVEPVNAH